MSHLDYIFIGLKHGGRGPNWEIVEGWGETREEAEEMARERLSFEPDHLISASKDQVTLWDRNPAVALMAIRAGRGA